MIRFFISYNKVDKAWAEWIAWTLEEAGHTVIIQAWDFRPGGNFVLDMQRAAVETDKTILVLSEDYLAAEFTQSEWAAAFVDDPENLERKIIPIKVRECRPRGLLRSIAYVDLVNQEAKAARQAILDSLPERLKPGTEPLFPRTVQTEPEFPSPSKLISRNMPYERNENLLDNPFKYTGVLANESKVYIPRECDKVLSKKIRFEQLIVIQGDFEIGKSSLLAQVKKMKFCDENEWECCYIDLQGMNVENPKVFMDEFFQEISMVLNEEVRSWRSLSDVLKMRPMIFCIDEFGVLNTDSSQNFISGLYWLRDMSGVNIRIIVCLPDQIKIKSFLKKRVANPRHWRGWETISIQPFTQTEVNRLLRFLPPRIFRVAYEYQKVIHSHSEGYPNKIQYLCHYLFHENITSQLRNEDVVEIINSPRSYDLNQYL